MHVPSRRVDEIWLVHMPSRTQTRRHGPTTRGALGSVTTHTHTSRKLQNMVTKQILKRRNATYPALPLILRRSWTDGRERSSFDRVVCEGTISWRTRAPAHARLRHKFRPRTLEPLMCIRIIPNGFPLGSTKKYYAGSL